MEKKMNIGEVAKAMGVPETTLRYYDKKGLFPGIERTSGGQRLFGEKEIGTLKLISCLKSSGLSMDEIERYQILCAKGNETLGERKAIFDDREKALKEEIASLEETLSILEYKRWYYAKAIELKDEEPLNDYPLEKMPPSIRKGKKALMALSKGKKE